MWKFIIFCILLFGKFNLSRHLKSRNSDIIWTETLILLTHFSTLPGKSFMRNLTKSCLPVTLSKNFHLNFMILHSKTYISTLLQLFIEKNCKVLFREKCLMNLSTKLLIFQQCLVVWYGCHVPWKLNILCILARFIFSLGAWISETVL